jgi:hypothetical protein
MERGIEKPFDHTAKIMNLQLKFIVSVSSLVVTIACAVFFGMRFSKQYQWEKKLASIEKTMSGLPVIKVDATEKDPHFLQTSFSQLPLLNLERGSLELLATKRELNENEKRRLQFIDEENFILFRSQKKTGSMVEEKLLHTVQIDENDLPRVLEILEGNPESSIRIKRLHLEKHPSHSNYNLYLELWLKDS